MGLRTRWAPGGVDDTGRRTLDAPCYRDRALEGLRTVHGAAWFGETNQLKLRERGVFICISPCNFPLAIFTGQITGALAAGNAVIAKPAEQTVLIAAEAVRLSHKAGLAPDLLALPPGDGATIGPVLTCIPEPTASPSPAAPRRHGASTARSPRATVRSCR